MLYCAFWIPKPHQPNTESTSSLLISLQLRDSSAYPHEQRSTGNARGSSSRSNGKAAGRHNSTYLTAILSHTPSGATFANYSPGIKVQGASASRQASVRWIVHGGQQSLMSSASQEEKVTPTVPQLDKKKTTRS